MLGLPLLILIGVCFAIIGESSKGGDLVKNNRWMLIAPIGLFVVSFLFLNDIVPEGENVTKLVKVTGVDTDEEYYWNLVVYKWIDADDTGDSVKEYVVYDVVGYISPETGKRVNVEPDDCNKFGREATFYVNTDDGWDSYKYRTTVNKSDIDVDFIDRIMHCSFSDILVFCILLLLAIYSGIKAYKMYVNMKKANYDSR